MSVRGTEYPVTFTRLPLKLRAMQWTGVNEKAIQDELAGKNFQAYILCDLSDDPCDRCLNYPDLTAEVFNDLFGEAEAIETGWWVCINEEGKVFAVSPEILHTNYVME